MPITDPFEEHTDRYDRWFETNEHAYRSELRALQRFVSPDATAVEIGVGTGRFAGPLGVQTGVDPSEEMLRRAADRGIDVVKGVAEALPFSPSSFETAVIVTTVCFVDDLARTLQEARRILGPNGNLVIGFIDRESPVGELYQEKREENPFYRDATFYSTAELVGRLERTGFEDIGFVQTIYRLPGELSEPDPVDEGYGEGSFVCIDAHV